MTEWRDIATAPKDGTVIFVWADGFEWPETVLFEIYDEHTAEEVGDVGYWRYAEESLAEIVDDTGESEWTHWMPLPEAPQ